MKRVFLVAMIMRSILIAAFVLVATSASAQGLDDAIFQCEAVVNGHLSAVPCDQVLKVSDMPATKTLAVHSSEMIDGWPLHAAIAYEVVASGMDGYTTMYLQGQNSIRGPLTREANPVLAPFANKPLAMAVAKTGVAVLVAWLLLKYHGENPRVAFWTATLMGVTWNWAAIHNQALIARFQQ